MNLKNKTAKQLIARLDEETEGLETQMECILSSEDCSEEEEAKLLNLFSILTTLKAMKKDIIHYSFSNVEHKANQIKEIH